MLLLVVVVKITDKAYKVGKTVVKKDAKILCKSIPVAGKTELQRETVSIADSESDQRNWQIRPIYYCHYNN